MTLFIDTHLNDVIIILYRDGFIEKSKIITDVSENSKVIMPTIKKLVNKENLKEVIVNNGPGSFTGVRLGVTIVKTIAYTLRIPVKTITSLECIAVNLSGNEKFTYISDNNGYYIGIFNENNELIGNYEYVNNDVFEEFSKKYSLHSDVTIDYKKVLEFAVKKEPINAHEVNPLYVKKLDVEK